MTHKYGLIKDTPNLSDRLYHRYAARAAQLPDQVDLSPWLGPVKNQEQFGCCTGEAISGLREWWLSDDSPRLKPGASQFICRASSPMHP